MGINYDYPGFEKFLIAQWFYFKDQDKKKRE